MPQVSCPSCKRKGTYSPKFEQCPACGLGMEIATVPDDVRPEVLHDGRVTPVTPDVTQGDVVTDGVTPHCPTCRCVKRTNAERQRAYRERKEG